LSFSFPLCSFGFLLTAFSLRQIREKEFTQEAEISVFCGTWNVNGKKPAESLAKWSVLLPRRLLTPRDLSLSLFTLLTCPLDFITKSFHSLPFSHRLLPHEYWVKEDHWASCDVSLDGGLPVPPVPQRRSVASVREKEREGNASVGSIEGEKGREREGRPIAFLPPSHSILECHSF
jgi:hypothetical protein